MMVQQTREIEGVRAKVRALLNKTVSNGCTEAEAFSAAEKAGWLMAQYAIEITELEVREEICITESIDIGMTRPPINGAISSLAAFCDCKWWVGYAEIRRGERIRKKMSYKFFGFPDDVKMAVYLYRVIEAAMETEVTAFKKTPEYLTARSARGSSSSFLHGMAARISSRLYTSYRERVSEVDAKRAAASTVNGSTPGTSIMVIKQTVVEDQYKGLGLNLTSMAKRKSAKNATAYHAGVKAGDRVNLNRPLNAGDTKPKLECHA